VRTTLAMWGSADARTSADPVDQWIEMQNANIYSLCQPAGLLHDTIPTLQKVGLCFIWSGLVALFSLRWEFGVDPQDEKPDDGLWLVLSADQARGDDHLNVGRWAP